MTHFVPYDSPEMHRGYARALCGKVASKKTESDEHPQCPECARLLNEDEQAATHLLDDTKPMVQLTGVDGNAFNILAKCRDAARKAGWPQERVDIVLKQMQAGNYDHLLATAMEYFDVH